MKDAIVGSRFQCSLEKGTLQLPPLEVGILHVRSIFQNTNRPEMFPWGLLPLTMFLRLPGST